jgi:hypothetical protein
MADFTVQKPRTSAARFAVGKDTGSLYWVEHAHIGEGIVIIPKGGAFAGGRERLSFEELLPPGTTITITT